MRTNKKVTCMDYPVAVFNRAEKFYLANKLHDGREFYQLAGYERELWVKASEDVRQMKKASKTKLTYVSDMIRREYLANPTFVVSPDIEFKPTKSSFDPEHDYVIVVKMPSAIFFYERWLQNCKMAFKRKYGDTKVSTIKKFMPERMKAIGESLGLELVSFGWDDGIAVTKYAPKRPKNKRVQVYNPKARYWVLVDTVRGRIIGNNKRMYKKIPIGISVVIS